MSDSLLTMAFEQSTTPGALTSADGTVLRTNAAFRALLGLEADLPAGEKLDSLLLAARLQTGSAGLLRLLDKDNCGQSFETGYRHPDGRSITLLVTVSPLRDTTGRVNCFCIQFIETRTNAQLADANARLAHLASTDDLTGLKNHRALHERLNDETARTRRYANPLSLLMLDVDRFKQYNDAFGRPQGDTLLRMIASLLQKAVRASDLPVRYACDEFAVVLTETDAKAARSLAERVRMTIEEAPWPERAMTVSIGVATFSQEMRDGAGLMTVVRQALYRSKQRGRNRSTHADDVDPDLDFCGGNSQPYTEIIREMLAIQYGMLTSAAERVKERLIDAYDKTIESWSKLLDMKDTETEGHSNRVTELTVRVCRSIGMNEEEILYARWGALLHDIGKIGIPDGILRKPGPLTEDEWTIMRRHPVTAYEMLSPITFLRPALDIPYGHHERWDGTGYPQNLKADDIPIAARLFAVVDVYDALRSDRPYRPGWPEDRVLEYLREQSSHHFDPRAVDAFLKMLRSCEGMRPILMNKAA